MRCRPGIRPLSGIPPARERSVVGSPPGRRGLWCGPARMSGGNRSPLCSARAARRNRSFETPNGRVPALMPRAASAASRLPPESAFQYEYSMEACRLHLGQPASLHGADLRLAGVRVTCRPPVLRGVLAERGGVDGATRTCRPSLRPSTTCRAICDHAVGQAHTTAKPHRTALEQCCIVASAAVSPRLLLLGLPAQTRRRRSSMPAVTNADGL